MTGLLDWLAAQCRCEISDLPRKLDTVRWLAREPDGTRFSLAEWEEAAAYLFAPEQPPSFPSVPAARAYFAERREPAPRKRDRRRERWRKTEQKEE